MEHSIDLNYLMQVSFGDRTLLSDMMEEWLGDTRSRIMLIRDRERMQDPSYAFTQIHNLKTSFFMVGHRPMIRLCEEYLGSRDKDAGILASFAEESVEYVARQMPGIREQ